jgi:uncharacterized protein
VFPRIVGATHLCLWVAQPRYFGETIFISCNPPTMARSPIVTIGIVSDTHSLLRPQAVEALRGSDRILHAGDIGNPEILAALKQIAPVTAIRGNIDTALWASTLPTTEVVEINGLSIYMLHDLARLDLKPEAAGFRVVLYGHSHKPKIEEKNGVLYFNPGSAGPRRFSLPVSVGKLTIADGEVRAELVELKT